MARRIYLILIIISMLLGWYLFMFKETHSTTFLLVITSLIFLLFSAGIHGLLAHSLKPNIKGDIIGYPIVMGIIWAVLFFLFTFFILPVFCSDFSFSGF
ncbi:hypothetical protein [Lutibacter citreus]|uniref:hypothetical protein n=1 Tax=Lutibacter citreus TaxID=2138210 RepID=UPI000DBE5BFF|nr:hypothetical protein [Lutibacter citreus]